MPTTDRPLAAEEVIRSWSSCPIRKGASTARPSATGRRRAGGEPPAIYYLLRAGEISAWHRVTDAAEVWHHYAGGALDLTLSADGRETSVHRLGTDLGAGERPQVTVPAGVWQTARCLGDWILVGCTVAPAFEFRSFEMAPAGWVPAE